MQQKVYINKPNKAGVIIASIIISFILILNVGLFFNKTALFAKFLAASSFFILLFVLILFWKEIVKYRPSVHS